MVRFLRGSLHSQDANGETINNFMVNRSNSDSTIEFFNLTPLEIGENLSLDVSLQDAKLKLEQNDNKNIMYSMSKNSEIDFNKNLYNSHYNDKVITYENTKESNSKSEYIQLLFLVLFISAAYLLCRRLLKK